MINVERIVNKLTPRAREAVMAAFRRVGTEVSMTDLVDAIARRDTGAIVRLLSIQPRHFQQFERELYKAFEVGGDATMSALTKMAKGQGVAIQAGFQDRNDRINRFFTRRSASMLEEVRNKSDQALQKTVQRLFQESADMSPQKMAHELVGKVQPGTRRRQGGVLGLTEKQAEWSQNARRQLESGDPKELRKYLKRTLRDKRYDSEVRKAIKEGRKIPKGKIDDMMSTYRNQLLRMRGETVARTELGKVVNESNHEGMHQLMDQGDILDEDIEREWDAANDLDTRASHAFADGQKVRGLQTAYVMGSGARLRYPLDDSLQAGAEEIANCRCVERTRVDFLAQLGRRRRG